MNAEPGQPGLIATVLRRSVRILPKIAGPALIAGAMIVASDVIEMSVYATRSPGLELGVLAVSSLVYVVGIALLTIVTVNRIDGVRPGAGPVLSRSVRRLVPVIAVSVVTWIAVTLGLMLLIVPGLIAMAALWVAVPAAAAEDGGVLSGLGRSLSLTKGHRLALFGLALALGLVLGGIGLGAVMLVVPMVDYGLVALLPILVFQGFVYAFSAIVVAVSYVTLREIKEGYGEDRVADIFG